MHSTYSLNGARRTLGYDESSYVASQLGHEDVEMVFRTYGKFIREDFQKPKPAPQLAK